MNCHATQIFVDKIRHNTQTLQHHLLVASAQLHHIVSSIPYTKIFFCVQGMFCHVMYIPLNYVQFSLHEDVTH